MQLGQGRLVSLQSDPNTASDRTMIDRVFAILESCAESRRTMSLADLARATGLPKSTLHRLCGKLVAIGALEPRADGYRIGARLFSLGALNPTVQRLRTQSMPSLYRMSAETGLTANVAVLQGDEVLLLDEVFRVESALPRMVGASLPLHATALGKALLSTETLDRRKELLGSGPLPQFTRYTVTDVSKLLREIDHIEKTGVAFSHDELQIGFAGVASPIISHGRGEGAVALQGMRSTDAKSYAGTVRHTAIAVAGALRNPVIRGALPMYAEAVDC